MHLFTVMVEWFWNILFRALAYIIFHFLMGDQQLSIIQHVFYLHVTNVAQWKGRGRYRLVFVTWVARMRLNAMFSCLWHWLQILSLGRTPEAFLIIEYGCKVTNTLNQFSFFFFFSRFHLPNLSLEHLVISKKSPI